MQSRLSLTNVVTCHFKTHGFSLRITVKKEKKTCKAVTVATPAGVKISYILQSIFLIFFYWIIFTSQCCVSFCCITKWISYMYTYILSPWASLLPHHPSYPSRSSQNTEMDSMCYTAVAHYLFYTWQCVYVSAILPIHSTLPSLFPVSTSPFPMSISLFLPWKDSIYIYVLIHEICFSLSELLNSIW